MKQGNTGKAQRKAGLQGREFKNYTQPEKGGVALTNVNNESSYFWRRIRNARIFS